MNHISYLTKPTGITVTLTWIKTPEVEKYTPYFQIYGICFNEKGEVLVIEEKGKIKIPGGTPEKGENAIQTLTRELIEEADLTFKKAIPLGVQKVEYPNNPNTAEGDLYYQYRFICLVDELLPQTPDSDTGITNPRKFISQKEVLEQIKWGDAGDAMFKDAFEMFPELLK